MEREVSRGGNICFGELRPYLEWIGSVMGRYRVAVDAGGTFCDFVVFDQLEGKSSIRKVPSTPEDPSRALLQGLEMFRSEGLHLSDVDFFIHGSTVATNALLEEAGAKTGLIISEGFRGIYETMEQSRSFGSEVFDLDYRKPSLLAPERATAEVRERIGPHGEIWKELDLSTVNEAILRFEREKVQAVAVCLLFSFMNPIHEATIAEILNQAHPEWRVSTSSKLAPQIREYYRLSTTVINAYVSPVLGRYVERLEHELDKLEIAPGRRFMMQSNGGSLALDSASGRAVGTMLSGPAGGVRMGVILAEMVGIGDVVTFDMGGTSCDVALIHDGEPDTASQGIIDGRHIALPMVDITTISAGGGTIARVGSHGEVHVGPQSAGAVPGPACYGGGGEVATVTDADMILGYLNPRGLLGGEMKVDVKAAERVIRETIAEPLGMDVLRAADGIVNVINVKMGEAIKGISTNRGFDLRDFTLIPFGGAGPVHACQIAQDLGIRRVLVPLTPGANSAMGLMVSHVKHDYVRSNLCSLDSLNLGDANRILNEMTCQAREELEREGFSGDRAQLRFIFDMRYVGQGYEDSVPLDGLPIMAEDLPRYRRQFDDIHKKRHGHEAPEQPVEVVNFRIEGLGVVPAVEFSRIERGDGTPVKSAYIGERKVLFTSAEPEPIALPVYSRDKLRAGDQISGPMVVEQYDSTTVVCPGQDLEVDDFGNLVITLRRLDAVPATETESLYDRTAQEPVDAMTVEVVNQALGGVIEEMQHSLFRTGYSTILRESRDGSCAITDIRGRLVAPPSIAPLHLGAYPACVESLLGSYALEDMESGDAFVINHPYEGGTPHATDMAVISPIVVEGQIIGFSASIAHKPDIGGLVPGTNSGQARESLHEGLLLPVVRLYQAGRLVKEVEAIIRANSRTPDLVSGDLRGQVGATTLGGTRVAELYRKYGAETVRIATDKLVQQTERRVRALVASWPDGSFEGEALLIDDGIEGGRPIAIRVKVMIAGQRLKFDFGQCDDQVIGPYNIRPPLVKSICYYVLKCLIGADLPGNAGLAGAIETSFRDGSILCPLPPAPVNTYMVTALATAEALFDALGKVVDRARIAESSGGTHGTLSYMLSGAGKTGVQYELMAGAIGAKAYGDGVSASKAHVANGGTMWVEILETEFPLMVERFELIPDSGGVGKYRGGLGYVREYKMLSDAIFATRQGKSLKAASGKAGGGSGSIARMIVNPGTLQEREVNGKDGNVQLSYGDVLRLEQAGGGGYGDPHARTPEDVALDVAEGYVSVAAARDLYGVGLTWTHDGHCIINQAETSRLRGIGKPVEIRGME